MTSSVLEHYNDYSHHSQMQWDGLRSTKFGRTKYFLPKRDLINSGLDIPNQNSSRGRRHFSQNRSQQQQFRSTLRMITNKQCFKPRQTRIRTFQMSYTQPHPRRQRSHDIPKFPSTQHAKGIRTFYGSKFCDNNLQEYSVQDKMQRKSRVQLAQIRKVSFMKEKEKFRF